MMDGNACKKRLDDFRRARDNAKSILLQSLYARAIDLTEGSLWVLSELFETAHEKHDEDNRIINNRFDIENERLLNLKRELDEARSVLETETDELSRSHARQKVKKVQASFDIDVSFTNTKLMVVQSEIRLSAVPALAAILFDDILAPDENRFRFQATVDGINVVIGLVPVLGNVYSGLLAIHGITTRRAAIKRNADKHAVYLEDYCHALELWGEAAQRTMRALQPLDEC